MLSPADQQILRAYLEDDRVLNRVLAEPFPRDAHILAECRAAAILAHDGKLLPGWDYPRNQPNGYGGYAHLEFPTFDDELPSFVRHDQGVGLYGGEWAILANHLLTLDLELLITSLDVTVQRELCARLHYCEWDQWRKAEDDGWSVLTSLCGWIIETKLHMAFPPIALGVFLLKRGVLDRWCGCNKLLQDRSAPKPQAKPRKRKK